MFGYPGAFLIIQVAKNSSSRLSCLDWVLFVVRVQHWIWYHISMLPT